MKRHARNTLFYWMKSGMLAKIIYFYLIFTLFFCSISKLYIITSLFALYIVNFTVFTFFWRSVSFVETGLFSFHPLSLFSKHPRWKTTRVFRFQARSLPSEGERAWPWWYWLCCRPLVLPASAPYRNNEKASGLSGNRRKQRNHKMAPCRRGRARMRPRRLLSAGLIATGKAGLTGSIEDKPR